MKINIDGIDVEGTPQEVAEFAKAMRGNATIPQPPVTRSAPPQEAAIDNLNNDPEFDEFIKNLYRYKPDRFAKNGKGPYIVQLLRSGQWLSMKQLMRLGSATQTVVSGAIRRAADAGCVIETTSPSGILMNNTKVRMISLGTPDQAREIRDSFAPSSKDAHNRVVFKAPRVVSSSAPSTTEEQILNLLQSKKNQSND